MNYEYKIKELISDLNCITVDSQSKGQFVLRTKETVSNNYPNEIQLSLMFLKRNIEYSPIEVINHTFAMFPGISIERCYEVFYRDLFNYIIFCRTDAGNEYVDFRGQTVKVQSIGEWITKG